MSCKNMYFEICLTKMKYCAFLIYFPSSIFKTVSVFTAGAIQKAQQHYFLSIHSSLAQMLNAPHTWWWWARKMPFTLFYAEILPFFLVFKLTSLICSLRRSRLRSTKMWIKVLAACSYFCETWNWKPSVDLINIMMEFNRKMMHHLITFCCIQMKPSCWQTSSSITLISLLIQQNSIH